MYVPFSFYSSQRHDWHACLINIDPFFFWHFRFPLAYIVSSVLLLRGFAQHPEFPLVLHGVSTNYILAKTNRIAFPFYLSSFASLLVTFSRHSVTKFTSKRFRTSLCFVCSMQFIFESSWKIHSPKTKFLNEEAISFKVNSFQLIRKFSKWFLSADDN